MYKGVKLSCLLLSLMNLFLLGGCASSKSAYYDSFTYDDLASMVANVPIDFSQSVEKLDAVEFDEPLLMSYIETAKSNQYTAVYILEGMNPENNGLVYNFYTEDGDDYYFEQFIMTDDDEGEIEKELIDICLGVSGKYYESNSLTSGLEESDEAEQITMFFENCTYSEAYEVQIGDDFYYCEVWMKTIQNMEEDTPYYFYFQNNELIAAQTVLSNEREMISYFIEFSDTPQAERLRLT